MKGFAMQNRMKRKDAYDIYFCVRNYPGGVEVLAVDCQEVAKHDSGREGYSYIREKFASVESYGPTSVRQFVEATHALANLTPEQWQQDAFGQVDAWLDRMGG
jgi:hypothetical protein